MSLLPGPWEGSCLVTGWGHVWLGLALDCNLEGLELSIRAVSGFTTAIEASVLALEAQMGVSPTRELDCSLTVAGGTGAKYRALSKSLGLH